MPRIIEYDERDYAGGAGGGYSSGAAFIVAIILILLYLGGYFPWITNWINTRPNGVVAAVEPETFRPVAPPPPLLRSAPSSVSYVIADNLNMRITPGESSPVSYILPRGTRVEYLGESYQEPDGDFWVQVRIQTYDGLQVGWVNRRYIS